MTDRVCMAGGRLWAGSWRTKEREESSRLLHVDGWSCLPFREEAEIDLEGRGRGGTNQMVSLLGKQRCCTFC